MFDLSNTSILVTGGCGFIGSHIVEILLENKTKFVRVLDNLITGKLENIQNLLNKHKNLELVIGDICDINMCHKAVKNIDIVCHQAALASVPRSIQDCYSSHNTNVNGFFNMLLASRDAGIKRFVFASSSSVYGDNQDIPKLENNIGKQLSPYAVTKHINELYANVFTSVYNMEIIGLRYFNIFGERQDPNGPYAAVIPKFLKSIKENKNPVIYGDGSASRDFTHVDNAVYANILAMTTSNSKCFGEVFNIAAGGSTNVLELFNILNKLLNKEIKPEFDSARLGDIQHSSADISKAVELLNFKIITSFENGMKKLISA